MIQFESGRLRNRKWDDGIDGTLGRLVVSWGMMMNHEDEEGKEDVTHM